MTFTRFVTAKHAVARLQERSGRYWRAAEFVIRDTRTPLHQVQDARFYDNLFGNSAESAAESRV